MPIITRLIQITANADSTAPTLTSPTATVTGTTTATGTVSTNEANGTLYRLASVNATELAATVVSTGTGQAVTATGTQNVSVTGLTQSTAYYLHYVHVDLAGNVSARVTSAQFTTWTPVTGTVITRMITIVSAGDTTAPTLTVPSATTAGPTSATGAVTTNEANGTLFRLASVNPTELASTVVAANQGQAVTATGSQSVTFTGLVPSTAYYAHYVHRDAANNNSARVTSAQFTTSAAGVGGVITRLIQITPSAETIASVSGSVAGSTITVTTGGIRNLFTNAPTLTYAGMTCTNINVTSTTTFTARMPLAGVALGSSNNFVLTVMGVASPGFAGVFGPALGQFATCTVPYAQFSPDSWARDDELAGITQTLAIGDQVETALKSNATTSTPAGYDVFVDGLGNIWLDDPTGSEGNLADETEPLSVNIALIDASDTHSRSNVMSIVLALNAPAGTLTLGTPSVTSTTASLPFTWSGTNASIFEYQIGTGSLIEIASSPIALSGLTANNTYTYRVRPKNGAWPGGWVSSSFTTSATIDLTPDPFAFTPQTGVARSTATTSNSIVVTGVATGQDVPIQAYNAEYSYSSDNGATWSAWASAAGNVRLNYHVRARVTSASGYSAQAVGSVEIGGVSADFTVTTLADAVAPVITLVGGNFTIPVGGTWTEPGFSALDNADGVIPVERLSSTGSVNTAVAGSYTITYYAEDLAGNIGTTTRIVTVAAVVVTDTVPPVVTLTGGNYHTIARGATWIEPGFSALDAVDGDVTSDVTQTGSVNTATVGVYTITYSVTDAAGNTGTAQRIVTVYDSSSFTDARTVVRVTKPTPVIYLYDTAIPTVAPKDPNSRVFYQFDFLGLETGESIVPIAVLINGTIAAPGATVAGLTYHTILTNGVNKAKIEVSGGTVGSRYRLTLRYATPFTPSDDRSQEFEVVEL